jgi:phosphopantetheinyl transferase
MRMLESQIVMACREKPPLQELVVTQANFLSLDEQEYCLTLTQRPAHDFLSGRQLLRSCFLGSFVTPDTNYTVQYVDNRPVVVTDASTYFCSLSHSAHFVACAIHPTTRMGIDIEEFRTRAHEFAKYIATPAEAALFQKDFSDQMIPTILWSIKEAAYKADQYQRNVTDYCILSYSNSRVIVSNKLSGAVFTLILTVSQEATLAHVIS